MKGGKSVTVSLSKKAVVKTSFKLKRVFTKKGIHPYDEIKWVNRDAKVGSFEQKNVEFPDFWSENAVNITASKYFRGKLTSPERERSLKQMINRVTKTIRAWGEQFGYFENQNQAQIFEDELAHLLIYQKGSFNSPVWFNVGVKAKPQCSACQPYRALVSTPNGFYPIGEIVEKNLVGLPVYDSAGVTNVVAVKNNGIKKVYKVILKNGTFIEATGDHLVKAVAERRTEPKWIRVDQLKKGMRLHLHPHKKILEQPSTPTVFFNFYKKEEAQGSTQVLTRTFPKILSVNQLEASEAALAGWLQADGFVGQYNSGINRSLTIEFMAATEEEKHWIESHLNIVFPDVHRKLRITKTKSGTPVTRIRLYGESLRLFVEKYELLNRGEKIRVPAILWRSKPDVIIAYLKSIFQSEGFIRIKGNSVHLALATTSKQWMNDLQLLLYGLGIYSRIRFKRELRANRRNLYELDISFGSERRRFAEDIGFLSQQKQTQLLASLELTEQKNIHDLREEEIVSIEEGEREVVYDIQTLSGEYLSNNIAVHNCFILSVEDNMESILEWIKTEGIIFKGGSGSGINLSPLRSKLEPLSGGGYSSGPVSFIRGADAIAGMIKSGGTTRRAAKMVVMDIDHPDILDFIRSKADEEKKIRALMEAGYDMSDLNNEAWHSIHFQNANNSVRITDEFMKAVEADGEWHTKFRLSGEVAQTYRARELFSEIAKAAWESGDPGVQFDTVINSWHTCPNSGRINASNPCSEYMHLDNSACNLASLNLMKFLESDGTFNIRDFKQAIRIFILAQEIIVDGSSYPTEKIAQNAHDFRELGLGFANLGALLMTKGLAYDSDKARAWSAAIASLLGGEAYRFSAEIAGKMGPFVGYEVNSKPMLEVIARHGKASRAINDALVEDKELIAQARSVWDEALALGRKNGFRNSQVTVIAPTGTIAFMMDCDTTGIEPDFSLVKMKQLVGGGWMKIVNQAVPKALENLGYKNEEIKEIVSWISEHGTVEGSPHIKEEHLAVFDTAVKPQEGTRAISWQGHVKMVAAIQPFISGAISKTFNMPYETTKEEIEEAYLMAWKLGIKAFAVYRDGSKASQPLQTVSSIVKKQKKEEVVEVKKAERQKLPATRSSVTHRFVIAGHKGYLTYSSYEDGRLAEIFIRMAKQGSTLAGLLDAFALSISISLQYGVPLKVFIDKFIRTRFEPAGYTDNKDIMVATSIIDYICRYLALKFLPQDDLIELGLVHMDAHDNGVELGKKYLDEGAKENYLVNLSNQKLVNGYVYASTVCRRCGGMMVQSGSCYTCLECGETSGGC